MKNLLVGLTWAAGAVFMAVKSFHVALYSEGEWVTFAICEIATFVFALMAVTVLRRAK